MGASACACTRIETAEAVPPVLAVSSSTSIPHQGPENINTWYFNVLELADEQVPKVGAWLLSKQRGVDHSSADAEKMYTFARTVCSGYLELPYHNVRHGVDVLHTVWRLGCLMPWSQAYKECESFSLMVAGLAHDIGHFGLTNVFLVDMRDELAIRYNDLSPLENMHCNKLFHILVSEKTNVLSHLSKEDFQRCRKLMIDAILNTDPAQHGAMVNDLRALYDGQLLSLQDTGTSADDLITELFSTADVKTLGARCLLHAADLSNPCRPWNIAMPWANSVLSEFFAQGDKEKQLGVPVGMLNDRTKVDLPSSQLGFIQFMVAPFVCAYTKVFTKWFDFNTILGTNVGEWARLILEETGKDESGRVEAVRSVLDLAKSPLEIKDAVAEICDAPSSVTSGQALVSWASLPQGKPPDDVVAAREVRRWREQQQDSSHNPETRQYRELLLIYMLSNGNALDNKDVILKFCTSGGHFNQPAALQSVVKAGEPAKEFMQAPQDLANERKETRVVSVAPAVDNVQAQISQEAFDSLLTSFLDSKDAPRHVTWATETSTVFASKP